MFVVARGIARSATRFFGELGSLADCAPASAVELKFYLIYICEPQRTRPCSFLFGWSFSSSINRGFHTEVGEAGTPVGVVEILSLSYSDFTGPESE
jgi:hypothetical protein